MGSKVTELQGRQEGDRTVGQAVMRQSRRAGGEGMQDEETEDADGTEVQCEKQCGKTGVCRIIPAFAGFVDSVAVFAVECIFYGNQSML